MPQRRHKNSGRQNAGLRFPGHLQFVRGFRCIVCEEASADRRTPRSGRIVAMHVDYAEPGKGASMKVHDAWTVPGCTGHHDEQHAIGWATFEKKYQINAKAIAEQLIRRSPKWLQMRETLNA
jgi:hypothetical protein